MRHGHYKRGQEDKGVKFIKKIQGLSGAKSLFNTHEVLGSTSSTTHERKGERERINIHANNIPASKYTKQISTDLKGEIECNTKIAEDSSLPFSTTHQSFREKIKKTQRTCSHQHNAQDRSYDESQYKCKELKKTETISSLFSNHNVMNLEINNRRKTRRFTNM